MKIIVEPKFSKYMDKLSKDERAILEQQLLSHGCTDPLVVWKRDGELVLLDGHNRYEICQKHAIKFNVFELEFDSEDEAIQLINTRQAGRRNAPLDKWKTMVVRIYRHLKKRSENNLVPNAANAVVHSKVQNDPSSETQQKQESSKSAAKVVGEQFGMSESGVKRLAARENVKDALVGNGVESAAELVGKAPQSSISQATVVLKDKSRTETEMVAEVAKIVTEGAAKKSESKRSAGKSSGKSKKIASEASKAANVDVVKEIIRLAATLTDADYLVLMKSLANTRMIGERRSIEVVIETLHRALPEKSRKDVQMPLFDAKPDELPLPESIATTSVSEAWKTWCRHLKSKNVEWSCDEANLQLKQLARSKPAKVVRIIEHAIANRMTHLPLAKDLPEDFSEMEVEEVLGYAQDKGISVSAAREFFLHYASQGWLKGNGQPVTNWQFQLTRWAAGQDRPRNGKVARKDGAVYVPGDEVESGEF